jgi:anti-anti-sigma factor
MSPPTFRLKDTDEPLEGAVFSCFRLPDAAGSVRLMMVGELDLVAAERARTAIRLAQNETRALTCDLGDVWFVDLSGLRVLLDAAVHAKLTGGRLTLANYPPMVPRMLQLLEFDGAGELHAAPPFPAEVTPGCCGKRRPHVS